MSCKFELHVCVCVCVCDISSPPPPAPPPPPPPFSCVKGLEEAAGEKERAK